MHPYIVTLILASQIILLDIVLSGDNAIVIAMAAAGLPPPQRRTAITVGMIGAVILRIAFCILTVKLYAINTMQMVGGILLLWVAIKMIIETFSTESAAVESKHPTSCLICAITTILVADVSMSLDNVLAVSALAKDHLYILGFGLVLSIGIMAIAAEKISGLIDRWTWLKIVGSGMITIVAVEMIAKSLLGFGISCPLLTKVFG